MTTELLLQELHSAFVDGFRAVCEAWKKDPDNTYHRIRQLTDLKQLHGNPLLDRFYIYRYGYAHALEVSNVYRHILTCIARGEFHITDDHLRICPMGYSPFINYWALAFAKNEVLKEDPDFHLPRISFLEQDLIYRANVIIFPRWFDDRERKWMHKMIYPERRHTSPEFKEDQLMYVAFRYNDPYILRNTEVFLDRMNSFLISHDQYGFIERDLTIEGRIGSIPVTKVRESAYSIHEGSPYPYFKVSDRYPLLQDIDPRFAIPEMYDDSDTKKTLRKHMKILSGQMEDYMAERNYRVGDGRLLIAPIGGTVNTGIQMVRYTREEKKVSI